MKQSPLVSSSHREKEVIRMTIPTHLVAGDNPEQIEIDPGG